MSTKKYLQQCSKEQLIEQILELEKKYKDVKTYYKFILSPNSSEITENTKKAIHKFFNPSLLGMPKLKEARKAVTDFKKLAPKEEAIADIMLYYVECGVEFTVNFGDMYEAFYNSLGGMYRDACDFISKNGLNYFFQSRCEKIVDDTSNMGWGFHDELYHWYSVNFANE